MASCVFVLCLVLGFGFWDPLPFLHYLFVPTCVVFVREFVYFCSSGRFFIKPARQVAAVFFCRGVVAGYGATNSSSSTTGVFFSSSVGVGCFFSVNPSFGVVARPTSALACQRGGGGFRRAAVDFGARE